ncbi:MAG: HEAT repeat domain-containing protein [Planctomycetes bacterium]|nr:HEAT repeat domain-containing protein [Planctomycetota bacterium]
MSFALVRTRSTAWTCVVALVLAIASASPTHAAVTPQSPEVQKLVASALKYLEAHVDQRLGGRCLIGLVFIKSGRPDHPRVAEALKACREMTQSNAPDSVLDVYSNGLAVIFLCELSPKQYAREIEWYLGRLKARQKSHGGWGYHDYPTGDTSQTQYAALSYWEAHRRGFSIDGASVENLADWLLKTQGPNGCWGYQGQVSTTSQPVEQSDTNCSMLAAGLGSLYICADLLNLKTTVPGETPTSEADPLPEALRRVDRSTEAGAVKKIVAQKTNSVQVQETMDGAHKWMEENYKIDIGIKRYYYLYGLERYKSFQEAFEGATNESPKWYNDGFEFLANDQKADGSWVGYCGPECDTAFATLFLLRSTQKSIRAKLGEGTLLAGRGLPTNLSRAKMRNGQLIVEQVHTKVDKLLSMIDDDDEGVLDELARDPSQLIVEKVDKQSARRLQQFVRGGEPQVRLLAVRALGRAGDLDYVPTLLYALSDPDRQVVLEARNGLRFISRNFDGFGPPDDFTDAQRFEALDLWKKWYLSVRPTAVLEE